MADHLLPAPPARSSPPSIMERLADIPEEEIWLAAQKGARTRRAYRLDVRHFMAVNRRRRGTPGKL